MLIGLLLATALSLFLLWILVDTVAWIIAWVLVLAAILFRPLRRLLTEGEA